VIPKLILTAFILGTLNLFIAGIIDVINSNRILKPHIFVKQMKQLAISGGLFYLSMLPMLALYFIIEVWKS
jgi:hypothetical protein